MQIIFNIVYYSISNILYILKSPFYWVVLAIVFFQYRKIGKMEKKVLGVNSHSVLYNTIVSMFFGILGGLIGSIIFILSKTTINPADFYFLFPLAILLFLIHPRFICFSYAGGIISLINLIFGYPDVNIPGIMMLIGVLHLVESFLILLDGDRAKIPIFMETEEQIVGGFMMNRFWPVPFTILINSNYVYPATVMAILGYGDYALTNYPEKKTKETAALLSVFSVVLILFARLSLNYSIFKYIGAIFSPLGHEIVIYLGRKKEKKDEYIFKPTFNGLKILDTLPKSIGETMNLNPGDIILSLNGNRVYSKRDIDDILIYNPKYIWMEIYDRENKLVTKEFQAYQNGINNLGIIVVGDLSECTFVMKEVKTPIQRLLNRLKKRNTRFKN